MTAASGHRPEQALDRLDKPTSEYILVHGNTHKQDLQENTSVLSWRVPAEAHVCFPVSLSQ